MSETTTATIARLSTTEPGFHRQLDTLLDWEGVSDSAVQARVDEILADVKQRGDQAVIDATNRFDRLAVDSMEQLRLSPEQLVHRRALAIHEAFFVVEHRAGVLHATKREGRGEQKRELIECVRDIEPCPQPPQRARIHGNQRVAVHFACA